MKKILAVLFLTILSVATAAAWDDAGHKLTAYIAWQRMTPEAREAATKILLAAPEDSDLSVFYLQDSRSEAARKRELFMIASTWADIVRDRKFQNRYEKYHKGNWHYSDFFWRQNGDKAEMLERSEEGGKAVEKLYEFDKLLRDPAASDADKAIALAWILHLGGDIHQPLHTSARVTDLEPNGDQGGNLFLITPQDKKPSDNIHWYWDSILGRNTPRQADACDSDYLFPFAERWMKKYPFAKFQNSLAVTDFEQWKRESFAYNPTDVFTPDLKRFEMPSEKYKKNAMRVSERQLTLAGYRLGELLNQIFANKTATASSNNAGEICKVIRVVPYPVSKTRTPDQKNEIALLNLCPENRGMVARPMTTLMVGGAPVMREYDVERIFKNEKEAREFAAKNNITDISF